MASINDEELRQNLLSSFGAALEEKLLPECVKLCRMFNMDSQDLLFKWEAHTYRPGASSINRKVTMDDLAAVKDNVQRDIAKASKGKQRPSLRGGHMSRNMFMKGPTIPPREIVSGPSTQLVVSRQDGFAMAVDEEKKPPLAGPSRVRLAVSEDSKLRARRYMYEKVSERSEVLDDRIDDFGELVKDYYKIDDLGDPAATTDEEVVVVGRITFDSESSSGGALKLNEASLALESSRMMGSGARIQLRFDPGVKFRHGPQGAGGVGLFPGAIVALRGKNGGGGWYLVSEVLSLPPLKSAPQASMTLDDSSFSAIIACGPFTTDSDLSYAPWQKLVAKLKVEKPAVVILIGPFIDAMNTCVKNGDLDALPEDIFKDTFTATLQDFLALSPDSLVLLLPSVRDVVSQHAVFPQSPLHSEFSGDSRIRLLPNPSIFSLNDLTFGGSSVDVVFHLRKEEFVKRTQEIESIPPPATTEAQANDLMSNTCRHILQQRSFYPIFPVPQDLSRDVNLDVTHSESLRLASYDQNATAPDIIITPSRLKHFSKMVDSTLFINPSSLSKGTFATLSYAGGGDRSVRERVGVSISKLEE